MRRLVVCFFCALVVLLLSCTAAAAEGEPFEAFGKGHPTSFENEGRNTIEGFAPWGTPANQLQGRVFLEQEFANVQFFPICNNGLPIHGRFIFQDQNGAGTVDGSFSGTICVIEGSGEGEAEVTGTFTIAGGTGVFLHAAGSGEMKELITDFRGGGPQETVVFTWSGTIATPPVVTQQASSVTQTSATLNAMVNPEGSIGSDCKFEYGDTVPYTKEVSCGIVPGSGTHLEPVSASVTGLSANTTYHFRVVATNSGGTRVGLDEVVQTPPNPTVESGGSTPGPVEVVGPPGTLTSALSVQAVDTSGLPAGAVAVVGGLSYTVSDLPVGGSADITLNLPPGSEPTNVYKLVGGVYNDVTALATISGNTVIMHLTDGGPGDEDGVANGVIVDPLVPVRLPKCPTNPPKVSVRWHYSAGGEGFWSVAREATCGHALTMGPEAMEGNLKVSPGKKIKAGYDFALPGTKKPFTTTFSEGKVVFKVRCVSGAKPSEPTFTVSLPTQSYSVGNANWYPSANQSSALVYEGEREIPALCGTGQLSLKEGGTFSTFMTLH